MQYCVLLTVPIAVFFWYFFSIKYKRNRFKHRDDIDANLFYQLFLDEKEDSALTLPQVIEAACVIANHLHLSWKKLRPKDSLYMLGPAYGWEYDDELEDFMQSFPLLTEQSNLADLIEIIGNSLTPSK